MRDLEKWVYHFRTFIYEAFRISHVNQSITRHEYYTKLVFGRLHSQANLNSSPLILWITEHKRTYLLWSATIIWMQLQLNNLRKIISSFLSLTYTLAYVYMTKYSNFVLSILHCGTKILYFEFYFPSKSDTNITNIIYHALHRTQLSNSNFPFKYHNNIETLRFFTKHTRHKFYRDCPVWTWAIWPMQIFLLTTFFLFKLNSRMNYLKLFLFSSLLRHASKILKDKPWSHFRELLRRTFISSCTYIHIYNSGFIETTSMHCQYS